MIQIVDSQIKEQFPDVFDLHKGIDSTNSTALIKFLLELKKTSSRIQIYDATTNTNYKKGTMISVSDHINLTGRSPIIGNQEKLGIEFIDMNNLYITKGPEIAFCANQKFQFSNKYNNHCKYLAILTIAARAAGFSSIEGYLYNI